MKSSDIREQFLKFFEDRGHTRVPSSKLVPEADPTLLFTNAGMNQFKGVFTGEETRPYKRAASAQKCVRAGGKHNDLENVGFTARHHTFFEMLGNFSFGDYFKKDAIDFAWDLITNVYGLDKDRLWITIYKDDDEADELWRKVAGVPAERIKRFGEKDNFWAMGDTGPCGPCSEIHYDQGPQVEGTLNGEGDRYLEIWNLVFMQFERDSSGELHPLPRPSIDTGMGLERITAILNGVLWNYDTDLFQPIIAEAASIAGVEYGAALETDTSLRVIADHARACAFLVTDGVLPSNEGRGYVLRRIMRRAIRHGVKLEIEEPFFWKVVHKVTEVMAQPYPDLVERRQTVEKVALREEEAFRKTLDAGLKLLGREIEKTTSSGHKVIPGEAVFKLHDTYGFPPDLTEVIATERGLGIDWEGYEEHMHEQRERGRASWKSAVGGGLDVPVPEKATAATGVLARVTATETPPAVKHPKKLKLEDVEALDIADKKIRSAVSDLLDSSGLGELTPDFFQFVEHAENGPFPSYQLHARSQVMMLATLGSDGGPVTELTEGSSGGLISWWTPFYAESGGQVGDQGRITNEQGSVFVVQDTQFLEGRVPIHLGRVEAGSFHPDDVIELEVDNDSRFPTRLHHSATHLVHAALRNHLGEHVKQAGSMVSADRLRFDFQHYEQVKRATLQKIEDEVNEQVWNHLKVQHREMAYDDAVKLGALAFFGEKYGRWVRVCTMGEYSKEFCGGTHVQNTGEIGLFRLVSEEAIAAGTRRIEALAGERAILYGRRKESLLQETSHLLKVKVEGVPERVNKLLEENKRLLKELERAQAKLTEAGSAGILDQAREVDGVKVLSSQVEVPDPKALREFASKLQQKLGSGVVVLGAATHGKAALVATVSEDLAGKRIHAGKLIQEISKTVDGKGGGRPEMAQGGGTNPAKLGAALERVYELVAG